MRIIGDSIFAIGILVLGWFILGLVTGHSFDRRATLEEGEWQVHPASAAPPGRASD
jgi:nitric oxide reductase subunit B